MAGSAATFSAAAAVSRILLLLTGSALLTLAACSGQDRPSPAPLSSPTPMPTSPPTLPPPPTPAATSPQAWKGVSLSPKSFNSQDFIDFFKKAKEAGGLVSWAGDWKELGNTAGGGPKVIAELAPTYGHTPVIVAQFFTQSTGQLLRPLDAATQRSYTDNARAFAERYRPRYLALGIEINILYEKSPEEFETFVQLFDTVYDAVKEVSPGTKVFPTFQLERLKGLKGGLFGGANEPQNPLWSLLERFPKADIAAFTTYPGLVFKDPREVPSDYYMEIASHTSKRVAFLEMGWHTAASPSGWESSEDEQAEFVAAFFRLTRGLNKEIVIWSFLYDPSAVEPFQSMGLLRSDGSARPAWEEWAQAT